MFKFKSTLFILFLILIGFIFTHNQSPKTDLISNDKSAPYNDDGPAKPPTPKV